MQVSPLFKSAIECFNEGLSSNTGSRFPSASETGCRATEYLTLCCRMGCPRDYELSCWPQLVVGLYYAIKGALAETRSLGVYWGYI